MKREAKPNPLDSCKSLQDVKSLVDLGCSPNVRDFRGATPLYWNRSITAIRAMIAAGADANVRDRIGATPLHTQKKAEIVRAIIKEGADVNAVDKDGYTALHLAWHPAAVFELLCAGADPNVRNSKGESVEANYGGGKLAVAMAKMVREVRTKGRLLRKRWEDYLPESESKRHTSRRR